MNKIINTVVFVFIFSAFFYAQENIKSTQANNSAKTKAVEILAKAKKAISSKIDVSNIKSLEFHTEGNYNGGILMEQKYNYKIVLKEKILRTYQVGTSELHNSKIVESFTNNTLKINESSVYAKGEKTKQDFLVIENKDNERAKLFFGEISETFLPYILDFPFIKTNGFIFIGVAESETGKADVLQTVTENKETYQLLFDQKSSRLLMMVKKLNDNGKEIEQNYYFTEYKENQGLTIPHKIIVKGNTNYGDLYIESNLKTFKVNPVFDDKTFEIKEK